MDESLDTENKKKEHLYVKEYSPAVDGGDKKRKRI